MHGLWSTNIPSRFLDELPEADVEVTESKGGFGGYGGYGASRFDEMTRSARATARRAGSARRATRTSAAAAGSPRNDGFDDAAYSADQRVSGR